MTRLESIMQAEERRAQKVQDLNARLQDPDIADYVARLFGEPIVPILSKAAPIAANGGNGNGHRLSNLTLTPAVKFIAESLPNRFLIQDVVKVMREGGFNFGERDPIASVRDSVYSLSHGEKAIFRVAVKGEGGKPNIYERI
ncbi:MAG TPA: hypothetical protein VFB28_10030 [Terriglobales bacterium]|nr:hypothetical protein [Terriglobales bacterium]